MNLKPEESYIKNATTEFRKEAMTQMPQEGQSSGARSQVHQAFRDVEVEALGFVNHSIVILALELGVATGEQDSFAGRRGGLGGACTKDRLAGKTVFLLSVLMTCQR